jgi:hypothetical protein
MTALGAGLAGLAGAGLMFLLDPTMGKRRRALVTDKAAHYTRVAGRGLDITAKDMTHRIQGLVARSKRLFGVSSVPDDVLVDRIRAELGRVVSNPSSIEVAAKDGCVWLGGPVLKQEHKRLVSAVRKVPGVHSVSDELDQFQERGGEPGLQGHDRIPARMFMKNHWDPTTRAFAIVVGSSVMLLGASRRDLPGLCIASAGAAFFTRGVANRSLASLVGIAGERSTALMQSNIQTGRAA